jgi:hypothetical protein
MGMSKQKPLPRQGFLFGPAGAGGFVQISRLPPT